MTLWTERKGRQHEQPEGWKKPQGIRSKTSNVKRRGAYLFIASAPFAGDKAPAIAVPAFPIRAFLDALERERGGWWLEGAEGIMLYEFFCKRAVSREVTVATYRDALKRLFKLLILVEKMHFR